MSVFNGVVVSEKLSGDAELRIEKDVLDIKGKGGAFRVDYADIKDIRLLNYHLYLHLDWTGTRQIELARLGSQTEEFFDRLWDAYNSRCQEALFLSEQPLMNTEGDYEYIEFGVTRKSKAKLAVYEDCLCILPHDAGARRVPFCFCQSVIRDGFWLTLQLDTGESYKIGRLGSDTDPFFDRIRKYQAKAQKSWAAAHQALEGSLAERLGDAKPRYDVLKDAGRTVETGLFSAREDQTGFWCTAFRGDKACMELFTGESTAAYLYSFQKLSEDEFQKAVRHAMEAVGTHRELIFMEEAEFEKNPLYRMAAERNRYVQFLRSALSGRVIHTGSWEDRIRESL